MICPKCEEFFEKYQCNKAVGECDCPKCQGMCECEEEPAGPPTPPLECVLRAQIYLTSAIRQWEDDITVLDAADRMYHLKCAMFHLDHIPNKEERV